MIIIKLQGSSAFTGPSLLFCRDTRKDSIIRHIGLDDCTAPITAYLPMVVPHTIVEFAPMVAPLLTRVGRNSCFLSIKALGLYTLVNTIDGPQNTSSSRVTPLYMETLFWTLHLSP